MSLPYEPPSEEEEEAAELKEEGSDLETEPLDLERNTRLRLAASFMSEKKIKGGYVVVEYLVGVRGKSEEGRY